MTTFNITGKELFDRMAAGDTFSVKLTDESKTSIGLIANALHDPSSTMLEGYKYIFGLAGSNLVLAAVDDDSKVQITTEPTPK